MNLLQTPEFVFSREPTAGERMPAAFVPTRIS
jgi:hypothetical protein